MKKKQNQLEKLENSILKRDSQKARSTLIYHYWIGSRIHGEKKEEYGAKGLQLAIGSYNMDPANRGFLFGVIHFYMDMGNLQEATELLKTLEQHKAYFKSNDPFSLGAMMYFRARIDFLRNRHMSVNGAIKTLLSCIEETEENPNLLVFMGILSDEIHQDEKKSLEYFYKAYEKGCRSPYLFIHTLPLIQNQHFNFSKMQDLFISAVRFAAKYDSVTAEVSKRLGQWMIQYPHGRQISISFLLELYEKWPSEELLHLLAMMYVKQERTTKEALEIYKAAIQKQIYIKNLEYMYLQAAYVHNYEKISLTCLQTVLAGGQLKEYILSFVYHILLRNKSFKLLLQSYSDQILLYGQKALREKKKDTYHATIYRWMLEKKNDDPRLMDILFDLLFAYEVKIHSSLVKYIWIIEPEKQRMDSYTVRDEKLRIYASSTKFQYYCVGQRQKTFYPQTYISMEPMIEKGEIGFYQRFYEKGFRSIHLLITLSKMYIQSPALSEEGVEVLKSCLEYGELSDMFRKQISSVLGSYFVEQEKYEQALGYFAVLEPQDIKNNHFIKAIQAMIRIGHIWRAVDWTSKRKEMLSDQVLFQVTKAAVDEKIYHPILPSLACELLQKGWYERNLLIYGLEKYDGSQTEWAILKAQMRTYGSPLELMDEKILERGIWIHRFDDALQDAFVSLYEVNPRSPWIQRFLSYCIYEVMVNQALVEMDTVRCMEQIFQEKKDSFLGYALVHVYLRQHIETENTAYIKGKVVDFMKQQRILYPIMKNQQDKFPNASYIEKNVPVVHQCEPGKKVYLHFRIFPDSAYHKKRMTYTRYGAYIATLSLFYHETISYYIEEIHRDHEPILYPEQTLQYSILKLKEEPTEAYDEINNALIYEHMLAFEEVEKIIENRTAAANQIQLTGQLL